MVGHDGPPHSAVHRSLPGYCPSSGTLRFAGVQQDKFLHIAPELSWSGHQYSENSSDVIQKKMVTVTALEFRHCNTDFSWNEEDEDDQMEDWLFEDPNYR